MRHFRKVWSQTINEWLKTTKGMKSKDAYSLFLDKFKITDVTYIAFKNQRSRLGASGEPTHNLSRKPKELYAEHIKKGYVRIKIAQPNVWMQKSKWVYMETHPWEDFTERSNYIFLDGNNRNFDPNNIERIPLRIMGIFNGLGGCEKGNPELTRLRVAQAKLKFAMFEAGEKLGLTASIPCKGRKFRRFKAERNRKAREYNSSPERKKIISEQQKKRLEKMKTENPVKYEMLCMKHREYMKEYYHKQKL